MLQNKRQGGRLRVEARERERERQWEGLTERWLRGAAPLFIRQHTAALQCDHTAREWGYETDSGRETDRKKACGICLDEEGGMINECVVCRGCWNDVAAVAEVEAGLCSFI